MCVCVCVCVIYLFTENREAIEQHSGRGVEALKNVDLLVWSNNLLEGKLRIYQEMVRGKGGGGL